MTIPNLSRLAVAMTLTLAAFASTMPAHAAVAMASAPLVNEAADGKSAADRNCVDCRARRFDGDMARIYFRGERRIHASEPLLVQVSYCSPEVGASYFPDEEDHVAAYLNRQNYRFK
jgi:hypothetical protein